MKSDDQYNQSYSTRRLEALTDGVFAIAMTLLVLDINIDGLQHIKTSADLWAGLMDMQGSIISFVVSFLLLGSAWAVHTRQFEFIKRADRHLIMINTLRLLTVVFIPLTTSISGNFTDLVIGRVALPLNFLALILISYWQWNYAVKEGNKLYEGSKETKAYFSDRNKLILLVSAAVAVASIFAGQLAFLLFLLVPFVQKFRLRR